MTTATRPADPRKWSWCGRPVAMRCYASEQGSSPCDHHRRQGRLVVHYFCECGRTMTPEQRGTQCPYCHSWTLRYGHTRRWHANRQHQLRDHGSRPYTGWDCLTCHVGGQGGPGQ